MKKICLISSNLLPVPNVKGGAIETIITNILQEQEKQEKIELTVVSIFDEEAYKESQKYSKTRFIYIKKNFLYYIIGTIYNISNKLFKTNFNTYNTIVLNKIKKAKFDYIFAEGGHYESYNKFLKYFKKEQLVLHLHHFATSNSIIDSTFSKVVGVSKYVTDEFLKTSSIEKGYVLKNSIDLKKFDKKISEIEYLELRNKYHISNDDFVIIYCGRLIKEKGVLELVKAVKKIKNNQIKLLIVGSINFANGGVSEYTEILEKEISSCHDKVILTGFIDNNELYKYYNIADVMVIPSIWDEAAGLVCVEGMISKKAIITTGTGGIKEYVGDNAVFVKNDNKLVNDIKEKILYLYNNPKILEKQVNKGYKEAFKYNNQIYYRNLVKLIEKMEESK